MIPNQKPRFQKIEQTLKSEFAPIYFELENESENHSVPRGSETHFRLVLVSNKFENLSRVDRQRLINDILKSEFTSGLHALTQRLFTPSEWNKAKDQFEMKSPVCMGKNKNVR